MKKRFYEGTGPVGPAEQANAAYREMRRSLIRHAEVEAEMRALAEAGNLVPANESILIGRLNNWRDRIMVFAAVYHVERDVASRVAADS